MVFLDRWREILTTLVWLINLTFIINIGMTDNDHDKFVSHVLYRLEWILQYFDISAMSSSFGSILKSFLPGLSPFPRLNIMPRV